MLKSESLLRLPRSVSAASLPCLLALAACSDIAPHRIDAGSTRQPDPTRQTDPKSYAQVIAQQQRSATQRVIPPPAQQQPAPAPPSAAAPSPAAATPPAAAPAATDSEHPGTLAMVTASGDVLATRLRDQGTPPVAATATSSTPPSTQPAPLPAMTAKTPTIAASPKPATPAPPDTTASSIPEPPVVQVTRGDREIRIPPTNPPANPGTASAAALAPTAVATTTPSATPAIAPASPRGEAPAQKPPVPAAKAAPVAMPTPAANPPPTTIASPNPHATGTPASAPPHAAAPGNSSALYGMPLPNLPALQNAGDEGKEQLAQADTAAASATGTSIGSTAEAAQAELRMAQNRIGLSDEQLQQLQAGQDRIASGDNGGAYLILQSLNAQLQTETRTYVVQGNESMWHVAGREEVYGNSYLWPLVWQANRDKVKKPSHLYKGMKLIIPAHPTAQEVAEALAYSKANNLEGMNQADSQ